jgi:hypothetical protein
MRWHSARVQRSVDRGCAGLAIELRNHPNQVVDPVVRGGRQNGVLRYCEWYPEPAESENQGMYAKLFTRKPGDPKSGHIVIRRNGPVGEGFD